MSGGINMFFIDRVIGNAYNNLTNILLVITPRHARTDKAILVGAHYDSIIGSLGIPGYALPLPQGLGPGKMLYQGRGALHQTAS